MNTGWVVLLGTYAKAYWIVPFLISVFLGGYIPKYLSEYLYGRIEKEVDAEDGDTPIRDVPVLPWLMGYVERALVTLSVMWLSSSAGTLIAGLLALKMAGGWGALKVGTTRSRAVYSVALVCSLISIMWAVGWGLLAAPWFPSQIKGP